jgi:hypothetical protein
MEHIINPWFLYLLYTVNKIVEVCIVFSVITGIVGVIYIIIHGIYVYDQDEDELADFKKGWGKKGKISILLFPIFIFISVFCPTKDELIAIYVADKVTYDIAEKALDNGKLIKDELKKDVIEIIESLTKEIKEKK